MTNGNRSFRRSLFARTFLLVLAALVFSTGCTSSHPAATEAQSPTVNSWRLSEELAVRSLAEGVWLHTTWRVLSSGTRFPSNGLIVREGDHAVLVDTAWGVEPTALLIDWIESELGLKVLRAVITHFHEDRMGGSPVLARRGIPFAGSPLTRELGMEEGVPLPKELPALLTGDPVVDGVLELFYPGPGHTRDNLVVWVPAVRLLFGGCAVRPATSTSTGNRADASMEDWPRSIKRVRSQYPQAEIVVPSHGPPAGPELLEHTQKILEEHAHSED